jgi:hypothetical protein
MDSTNGGSICHQVKEEANIMESPSNKTTGLASEPLHETLSHDMESMIETAEELTYEQMYAQHETDRQLIRSAVTDFQVIADLLIGGLQRARETGDESHLYDIVDSAVDLLISRGWVR